jgi:hypothetical protein
MNNTPLAQNLVFVGPKTSSWPARPFRIVTLLDMLEFHAEAFYLFINWLDAFFLEIGIAISDRGKDSPLTAEENLTLQIRLTGLRANLENMGLVGFKRTAERLEHIAQLLHPNEQISLDGSWQQFAELSHPNEQVSLDRIWQQMEEVRLALKADLRDQRFLSLPSADIKYYQQEQRFGLEVFTNFPSTRHDVEEAANCYATGRYTACVFHCMRVVEKGLHTLVRELNDKHNAGITFRDKVEYENWGAIITEIQLALENPKRIKRLNPLPTKEEMTFYSKVAIESEYIKNAWRDDVAHSRSEYDQPGALSVMDHVEAFMKYLAKQGLTE